MLNFSSHQLSCNHQQNICNSMAPNIAPPPGSCRALCLTDVPVLDLGFLQVGNLKQDGMGHFARQLAPGPPPDPDPWYLPPLPDNVNLSQPRLNSRPGEYNITQCDRPAQLFQKTSIQTNICIYLIKLSIRSWMFCLHYFHFIEIIFLDAFFCNGSFIMKL